MDQRYEDCCMEHAVHGELIETATAQMPPIEHVASLSELFKVFGDTTRLRILFVLSGAEVCVCDLSHALGMTVSAVSHQLKILKQNKLVKSRREGKSVFYALADAHVLTILRQGMEHVEE